VHASDGQPVTWEPSLVVLPVSSRLCDHYVADAFEREVASHAHELVIAPPGGRDFPPPPKPERPG
jgi:hypothetical protein